MDEPYSIEGLLGCLGVDDVWEQWLRSRQLSCWPAPEWRSR